VSAPHASPGARPAPAFDPAPRFNHVALSVPAELLSREGREDLLDFYGDVFGWTEMPTLSEDGKLLVLRAWRNDQFVFLQAADDPMRCDAREHFGLSVARLDQLDRIHEAARRRAERDPRVEIVPRKTDDFQVLKLHAFYLRYRIPLWIEVQCFEWAQGVDARSLPGD
jgi:hypothetical protein